jgi:hypothetical protein
MWDLKTGGIAEGAGTAEAVEVLEAAFRDIPASWSHPGLLHLYVHLMEMSPFPQRALRAGDRLRDLVPDAGHLIHMPTHIDVLCGHYRDVLVYNHKAIVADRKFLAREGALNVYALYRTHDYHFAVYGAMFLGQYGPAMEAAQELIDTTPEELLRIPSPPMADFVEGYLPMKQHVLVRFGKWHEIIAQELPGDRELYCSTTAMMLYAQAVAHSALGHIAQAEAAKAAFIDAKLRVPESRRVHNNTVRDLLAVAEEMLNGELEYRRGHYLRRAVGLDAADPPRARRAVAGTGPGRRGRGDLPLGSRPRRQAQPGLPASRQPLEPARAARMPDPARRDGRGCPDQAAPRSGAGKVRGAGEGLLLLPYEGRGLSGHHEIRSLQLDRQSAAG